MAYRDSYRATEEQDRLHRHQLWWSFAVASCLGAAAIFQLGNPKNALLNEERAPASVTRTVESAPTSAPKAETLLRADLARHQIPGLPGAALPETHLE